MQKTKYGLSFVVAASSVLLLVACGDDNSTKANDKIVVDSVDDLSNCVATKMGNLEYVDTVAYVCHELGDKIKWVQVAGVEDNPEDFRVCSGKKDGLYSFSTKENTLYVCNDEEWVPVKQLDDNDSVEESGSSEAKSSSSSVTPKSSSSETSVSSSSVKSSSSVTSSSSAKDVILSSSEGSSDSKSSSSEKAESSSSKAIEPAEGMLTDSRDGKTYKTVTTGTQTWMAENLNYAYIGIPYKYTYIDSSYTSDSTSWCYGDKPANCTKYGRLYTWAAAMDSVGTWSTNSKGCGYYDYYDTTCSPTYPVRGICPEGWHLPTKAEFETLFAAVGGKSTAGKMLKFTSGWYYSDGKKGTDDYSFTALPAGFREYNGEFYNEGHSAYFWSSTEYSSYNAHSSYYMRLDYDCDGAGLDDGRQIHGFSVRCLKD